AILWVLQWRESFSVLFAYDATDLTHRLYSSEDSAARDHISGEGSKFAIPMVYGGNVFVGGQNHLAVFGLLP
ncbi:MAG TPA: pyrrolo-quinoline quinone, partial [Terriglobales bacterium]